jgi:hypothetical protein
MIFILAGTLRQAEDYARSIGLRRSEIHIISDERRLRGLRNVNVRLIGSYYQRRDWYECEAIMRHSNITTEVINW